MANTLDALVNSRVNPRRDVPTNNRFRDGTAFGPRGWTMTSGEQRQKNIARLGDVLRRYVPADANLTDTQLVEKTAANFWHDRATPLIDPNE